MGAVGVVCIVALAVGVVGTGLRYAAEHRYEGQMGASFNSDDDDGPAVQLGLVIAAAGLVLAGAAGTTVRRTRARVLGSVLALGLVAAVAGAWASGHAPDHRCASDRYAGVERCVSEAGAVQRDVAVVLVPTGLVLVVFWAVPRVRSAKGRPAVVASPPTV